MKIDDDEWSYYQKYGDFPTFQWRVKTKIKKFISKFFSGIFIRGDLT